MDLSALDGYVRAKQWTEALTEAKRLIHLHPTHAAFHWYEGMIYYANERFDLAEPGFRRATSLDPKYSAAGAKLAQCLYRLHRYEEAFSEAKFWLKIAPNDHTLQGLVYTLEHQVGGRTERWEKTRRLDRTITFGGQED